MTIWFFLGDTFDWLEAHETVSGVPRVTVELFYGALDHQNSISSEVILPCTLTDANLEVTSISLNETLTYLALKATKRTPLSSASAPPPQAAKRPLLSRSPKPGDYVLFTGVVWTPLYIELFRRLTARGVRICVLIHDIIPVERADLVSDNAHNAFTEWLGVIIATARILFVSSRITKDHILRWAVMSGHEVRARIAPITFGSSTLRCAPSPSSEEILLKTRGVDLRSFVLSVGTLDPRKNQLLLLRVWKRLVLELGEHRVPQLVLAGRNDFSPVVFNDSRDLLERSTISMLGGLSDQELGGLYRACLFTVFPSLSEGYGLPVAESLRYGKLCISSNLATIREHAGDLAWYFDPNSESAAFERIRLAIERPDLRFLAEQRIISQYSSPSWQSAFNLISKIIHSDNVEELNLPNRT